MLGVDPGIKVGKSRCTDNARDDCNDVGFGKRRPASVLYQINDASEYVGAKRSPDKYHSDIWHNERSYPATDHQPAGEVYQVLEDVAGQGVPAIVNHPLVNLFVRCDGKDEVSGDQMEDRSDFECELEDLHERLTLKLSRIAARSQAHGKLYLPCAWRSDVMSA